MHALVFVGIECCNVRGIVSKLAEMQSNASLKSKYAQKQLDFGTINGQSRLLTDAGSYQNYSKLNISHTYGFAQCARLFAYPT